MFNKAENDSNLTDPTKISQSTSIDGEISSKNDIRLDGNLKGKIFCKKKIIIGKTAVFIGELHCENLIIEGAIDGQANVSDTTSMSASSSFNGSLSTHKFTIEYGASFDGNCKTIVQTALHELIIDTSETEDESADLDVPEEDQNNNLDSPIQLDSDHKEVL